MINVGTDWHLYMSDGRYEPANSAVIPTLNPPAKQGIAISGDKAWERLWFTGNNVLDDPYVYNGTSYRYRIYCAIDAINWRDENGNFIPTAAPDPVMGWRKMTLVLTNDFVTFIKPNLNIFSGGICNGSSNNNVLSAPPMHVFKDTVETNPTRRYKGLASSTKDGTDVRIWYSADGVTNWTMHNVAALSVVCDAMNVLEYDSASDSYIAYVRSWWYKSNRCLSRITIPRNQLYQAWPAPSTTWYAGTWGPLISAESSDLLLRETSYGGYYGAYYSSYYGIPLFQPALLNESTALNKVYAAYGRSLTGAFKTPQNDSTLSPVFIEPGASGTSDSLIYATPLTIPISSSEEIFLYSGYEGDHDHNAPDYHNYIHKAKGRKHGLITLKSTSNVTTTSEAFVLPSGVNGLLINAKAPGTSSIKFALCDINGTELSGFGLAQSNAFTGDNTETSITWAGSPSWASLGGQTIRVKTQITASSTYPVERASFKFTSGITVQFPVTDLTIRENCGSSPFQIPLLISSAPSSNLIVTVTLTSGNSSDIGGWTSGTVTFPAGSKQPQMLEITKSPSNSGANTPLVFTITPGSGYTAGSPFTLTFVDDDITQSLPPCADPVFIVTKVNGSANAVISGVSPNITSHTLPQGSIVSFSRTNATVNIVGRGMANIIITPNVPAPFNAADFAIVVPVTVTSSGSQLIYGDGLCSNPASGYCRYESVIAPSISQNGGICSGNGAGYCLFAGASFTPIRGDGIVTSAAFAHCLLEVVNTLSQNGGICTGFPTGACVLYGTPFVKPPATTGLNRPVEVWFE